jgi:hypothetical protein
MPPSRRYSYIFYPHLTGWIALWLLLTSGVGVAYAEEATPSPEGAAITATQANGAEDQAVGEAVPNGVPNVEGSEHNQRPGTQPPDTALALAPEAVVNWASVPDPSPPPGVAPAAVVPVEVVPAEAVPWDTVVSGIDPALVAQHVPTLSQPHSGTPVGWDASVGSAAMGQASALPHPPPNTPVGYPTGALVAIPASPWPAYPVGVPQTNAPIPSMGGSVGGAPIPWAMTQGGGGTMVPGMPGMPGMAVAPGMPGMPTGAGMWMMVWVPYGAPMVPTPGNMAPPPGSVPPGMVGYVPVPYGVMPGMPMPGMPMPGGYGMPPNPYAYGTAGMPYGVGGAMPPGMVVQPYAQVEPPPTSAPLAVPSLPRLPSSGNPTPLLPPSSSIPAVPGGGMTTAQSPPFPGASTVPSVTTPFSSPDPFNSPAPSLTSPAVAVAPPLEDLNQPITETSLSLQGLYVLQGDQSSARARLSGDTFLTPNLLVGGALDLATGPDLTNRDGVQLTELYVATSVSGAPGLRFRLGQLDMTSYFDRNSFAKDVGRDFFNATFHTNPALIAAANATASHPGGLVQWSLNDNLILSASAFSSAADLTNFALDGFAGEVGLRTGDLILRGSFLTGQDTDFRGTGDRLAAYGLNAEWFLPQANIGLFGRYGRLNSSSGSLGENYSVGLTAFDVFMDEDRIGLAYGRNLPTASVDGRTPDVLEVFYDFVALPNVRVGFTFQQRNQLQESFAGFRIRSDIDLLPTPTLR